MASIPEIFKWEIYCTVDETFVSHYGPTAPTTCPNDAAHVVNANSVIQKELINTPNIVVTEEIPSPSYFQVSSVTVNIPAPGSVPSVLPPQDFTFPFDLYLREMSISQNVSNIGDVLNISLGPDTIIGTLTSPASIGDTVLNCDATVFTVVVRGSEIGVQLSDFSSKEYPDRITDVDEKDGTVTMETPLTANYPTGSFILITVYSARNLVCDSGNRLILGGKGLQNKKIPKGTIIRVDYTDTTMNAEDTKMYLQLQYYHS